MSEKDEGGPALDRVAQGFGLVVAYLCPGFLALWGLQERFPSVKQWLGTAAAADTSVGGFFFVAIAAAGIGVILWSVGSFVIEDVLAAWLGWLKLPPQTPIPEGARQRAGIESAYRDLRDQHFRYYQFHAAMLVALPLIYVDWAWRTGFRRGVVLIGVLTALLVVVVARSAFVQLKRYAERRAQLLRAPGQDH